MVVKNCPCEDDVQRIVYAKYFCLNWKKLRIPAWHHSRNGTFQYRTSRRVLGYITSDDRGLAFVRDKDFSYGKEPDTMHRGVLLSEVVELCAAD